MELADLVATVTELKHPIKDWLSDEDISMLFDTDDGVINKVNSFCSRIENLAVTRYGNNEDDLNKFKGDLFELFVEFMIKVKGGDNRVAITAYQTIEETDYTDYGVDGIGKSTINGRMATVQVKYRQQHETLTWNSGNFGNFGWQSTELIMAISQGQHYPTDNTQMLYITSAGSIHHSTDEISSGKIQTITRNGLRELCDNVDEFWIQFKDSVISSRIKREKVKRLELRNHQVCAVNAIIDDMRIDDGHGRVVLPTGTGKTLVQAQTIIEANKEFGHDCFVILSPRILLAYQHLVNVADHLISYDIDAEFVNVNSGSFDESIINSERAKAGFAAARIKSTTLSGEIAEAYRRAKEDGKILVISSTYHSAERIRSSGIHVDIQMNDEAHNMVSDEFSQCHGIGANCFHFTATEKYTDCDNGLGMNNEDLWGNLCFEKLPKEMIEAGEMLPPVLHIVETNASDQVEENDYNAIFNAIAGSFGEHRNRLDENSARPDLISPKLLVTVGGQEVLKGIIGENGRFGCDAFERFRARHPNVSFFAISSELGAYINGSWSDSSNKSKDEFLKQVRQLEDADEAIILYVDMLTEGIDVPGITAFMPLRGLSETRFKQGVGRCTRLFGPDRKKIYAGEIGPANPDDYIKPFAEIVIPTVLINSRDNAIRYVKLWESLYDDYGHQEHVVLTHYNGKNDDPENEDKNTVDEKQHDSDSGIEEFIHRIVGRPDKLDIDELWLIQQIISE